MDSLLYKLSLSVTHLQCLDHIFSKYSFEYNNIKKELAKSEYNKVLEEISKEIYAGGKTKGNSIQKLNRQMILGDVIEYIFSGRAYYFATRDEDNLPAFLKLILYCTNLLLLYDKITVNPFIRKAYILRLEKKIPKKFLYEKIGDELVAKKLLTNNVKMGEKDWDTDIDYLLTQFFQKLLVLQKN